MKIPLQTAIHMAQICVRLPASMNGLMLTAENSVDFAVCITTYLACSCKCACTSRHTDMGSELILTIDTASPSLLSIMRKFVCTNNRLLNIIKLLISYFVLDQLQVQYS